MYEDVKIKIRHENKNEIHKHRARIRSNDRILASSGRRTGGVALCTPYRTSPTILTRIRQSLWMFSALSIKNMHHCENKSKPVHRILTQADTYMWKQMYTSKGYSSYSCIRSFPWSRSRPLRLSFPTKSRWSWSRKTGILLLIWILVLVTVHAIWFDFTAFLVELCNGARVLRRV